MAIINMPEATRLETVASTLKQMEVLGHRLRELVATQPPCDLMGYVYGMSLIPEWNRRTRTNGAHEQHHR